MRILVPTADYPPIEGGISTVALHLSRELAALGHEVTVVAPWFPGMREFDDREPLRVRRYRGYGFGWLRVFPMLAACLPHLRSTDLVLGINVAYGGVIGWLASRAFNKRYVTFAYAYEFLKFSPASLFGRLVRAAYNRSNLVVAISAFTRANLERFGVDATKIETVLPGSPLARPVDAASCTDIKERLVLNGHPIILAVGRFVPRKGHATLVRALPRILERHPGAVLVCAGQGPALPEVTRLCGKLGLREHVRFPGKLSDGEVAALYEACTVFALPTGADEGGHVEGFGLVFAEAAAHGKPVVAGRSGGVPDAVLDGETGLLVEPGDPEALSNAIDSVLSDAALAQRLGANGRARVEKELNWPAFTRRLLDVLEQRA